MSTKLLSEVQKEDISKEQGVMSGIEALDNITGGFHNSNLLVLAGRPAMGRRSFALTCAYNQGVQERKLLFSASHSLKPKSRTDCRTSVAFLTKEISNIHLKTKYLSIVITDLRLTSCATRLPD